MGWKYIRCNDLKERIGVCDLCGTSIRYEHICFDENGWIQAIGSECASRVFEENICEEITSADKKMKANARKDARNEILYQQYLARCDVWDEKNPNNKVVRKTKEEIYG